MLLLFFSYTNSAKLRLQHLHYNYISNNKEIAIKRLKQFLYGGNKRVY